MMDTKNKIDIFLDKVVNIIFKIVMFLAPMVALAFAGGIACSLIPLIPSVDVYTILSPYQWIALLMFIFYLSLSYQIYALKEENNKPPF